jgi:hypothetical protein
MKTIPKQHKGDQSDVGQHVDASTPRQAHSNFVEASRRLLNVSNWHETAGPGSATFQLMDSQERKLDRLAKVGDFIRIDIPGPGSATGNGYDWVRIESIDDNPDPGSDHESLVIRVRPTSNPGNAEPDVAHFFRDSATSTFMIERHDLRVTASIHGRNEVPNTDVERTVDKVRNTVVANAATSGIAALHWSLLVKGVLRDL